MEKTCIFKATEEAKRLVFGVVLEPDTEDLQGDILEAHVIEEAAHAYLANSRIVAEQHAYLAEDVSVVESYLAPTDFQMGDETIRNGSWVMAVHIANDELWEGVTKGEFTGFSIGGSGIRTPI